MLRLLTFAIISTVLSMHSALATNGACGDMGGGPKAPSGGIKPPNGGSKPDSGGKGVLHSALTINGDCGDKDGNAKPASDGVKPQSGGAKPDGSGFGLSNIFGSWGSPSSANSGSNKSPPSPLKSSVGSCSTPCGYENMLKSNGVSVPPSTNGKCAFENQFKSACPFHSSLDSSKPSNPSPSPAKPCNVPTPSGTNIIGI